MKHIYNFGYVITDRILALYFKRYPHLLPFFAYYTMEVCLDEAKKHGFSESMMESAELFSKSVFELRKSKENEA